MQEYSLAWCYSCNDFIYSPSSSIYLCSSCYSNLPWFNTKTCGLCLTQHQELACPLASTWGTNQLHALFWYAEPLRSWFTQLKYGSLKFNAQVLTDIILSNNLFKDFILNSAFDYVVNVPRKTGIFSSENHSQYVLHALARTLKFKISSNLITKSIKTKKQASLNREKREINMQNPEIFSYSSDLKGKALLLFDDVCTTGSTIKNIAHGLKNAGVSRVSVLCLFREG